MKQLNEIKRMQRLAGLLKEEANSMRNEGNFIEAIISTIKQKYPDLIANRDYDTLGAAIEKDFPMLRSDIVIGSIFGDDTPEELSTPPNE